MVTVFEGYQQVDGGKVSCHSMSIALGIGEEGVKRKKKPVAKYHLPDQKI